MWRRAATLTLLAGVLLLVSVTHSPAAHAEPGSQDLLEPHAIVCPSVSSGSTEDCGPTGTEDILFSGVGQYGFRLQNSGGTYTLRLQREVTAGAGSSSGTVCIRNGGAWAPFYLTSASGASFSVAAWPSTHAYWYRSSLSDTGDCTGDPGPPPEPADEDPAVGCEVRLENSGTLWRAQFVSYITNVEAGHPDSFLWDFGDGSSSTESDPGHTYAEPDDGGGPWEVTLTVTREGGTTPTECHITFDFYGPDQVEGDGGEVEASCPNPALYNVVGWMKRLFLPCGDYFSAKFTEWYEVFQENWPVAPVIWFVETMQESQTDFATGDTPAGFPPLTDSPCETALVVTLPTIEKEASPAKINLLSKFKTAHPGGTCALTSSQQGYKRLQDTVHAGSTVAGFFLVALAIYNAAYGMFGQKTTPHVPDGD